MSHLSLDIDRGRACASAEGLYFAHVWSAGETRDVVSAQDYTLDMLTEPLPREEAVNELTLRLSKRLKDASVNIGNILSVAYLRLCFEESHKGFKPNKRVGSALERVASYALEKPSRQVVVLNQLSGVSNYLPNTRVATIANDPRSRFWRMLSPSVTVIEPPITLRELDDQSIVMQQGVFDYNTELVVGLHCLPPKDSRGEFIETVISAQEFWSR